MHVWLILIALLVILFTSPIRAFWEEFNIITEKEGRVRVTAKYRFQGYTVSIRSTTPEDKGRYIDLLEKQKIEYVPVERAAEFFENNNLERQKQGRFFHLYAVSCGGEDWGFLHLGRKKTVGVLNGGVWSSYNGEKDKVLKLWENLQIVQSSLNLSESYKRIGKRGLARLLPVIDPTIHDVEKQMCLELGFQLVCKLASKGYPLLPEKKIGENKEEETVPYQVIAEMYGVDPLCKCFSNVDFIKYDHPYGSSDNGYMDQIYVRAVVEGDGK